MPVEEANLREAIDEEISKGSRRRSDDRDHWPDRAYDRIGMGATGAWAARGRPCRGGNHRRHRHRQAVAPEVNVRGQAPTISALRVSTPFAHCSASRATPLLQPMPSFTRERGGTLHVAVMGVNRIGKHLPSTFRYENLEISVLR